MRILYSVQRYGEDIVGGSESACRHFAEHLVNRGHTVEVVTSCARSYVDWQNAYDPGSEVINGVTVHRLPVRQPRRAEVFGPLDTWVHSGPHPVPSYLQHHWARAMGPELSGHRSWLLENYERFDVAVFMTYLYATSTYGLPTLAGLIPTVLQPTAHDEPPFRVDIMNPLFRLADAMLFFTPEEHEIVQQRFLINPPAEVVGIGIDIHHQGSSTGFRETHELGNLPYLLYTGRIDPMKGAIELLDFFIAFKKRNPGDLKLVMCGEQVVDIPDHPDVMFTGFLSEQSKHDALSGALALVQPSYFESFSIVLCESWVQKRPALVQSGCEVLSGQAHRSQGAIPYHGYAEFESTVNWLLSNPTKADQLGKNGYQYVRDQYDWDAVLLKSEKMFNIAISRFKYYHSK